MKRVEIIYQPRAEWPQRVCDLLDKANKGKPMMHADMTAVDEGLTCDVCGKYAEDVRAHYNSGGYCAAHAYLTIPEALAMLDVSRATFYRLVRRGHIHPKRTICPVRVLVPRAEVESLVSSPGLDGSTNYPIPHAR